jgi:hypothetical protein
METYITILETLVNELPKSTRVDSDLEQISSFVTFILVDLDEHASFSEEQESIDYSLYQYSQWLIKIATILAPLQGFREVVEKCLTGEFGKRGGVMTEVENLPLANRQDIRARLIEYFSQTNQKASAEMIYREAMKEPDLVNKYIVMRSYMTVQYGQQSGVLLAELEKAQNDYIQDNLLHAYHFLKLQKEQSLHNWREGVDQVFQFEEHAIAEYWQKRESESEFNIADILNGLSAQEDELDSLPELSEQGYFPDQPEPSLHGAESLLTDIAKLAIQKRDVQVFTEVINHPKLNPAQFAELLNEVIDWVDYDIPLRIDAEL